MLYSRSPHEAYRRVDFDARVEGADPRELVKLCYEALTGALGTAIYADERQDDRLKSQSLTRALSAVTALQLGVNGEEDISVALHQFYQATRRAILDSALEFDAETMASIRQDFIEISRALSASQ